jgi:hypothetical protein
VRGKKQPRERPCLSADLKEVKLWQQPRTPSKSRFSPFVRRPDILGRRYAAASVHVWVPESRSGVLSGEFVGEALGPR